MGQKHKHAELIKAWADGASIEKLTKDGWLNCEPNYILWSLDVEYRIKPESKLDVASYFRSENYQLFYTIHHKEASLKVKWDGETGKLKSAEVIS